VVSSLPPPPIDAISSVARSALRSVNPSPFSESGFEMLESRIEQHIDDLILESIRIMHRHQADTVSPSYVAQASENLVAGRRRKLFTLVGTLGGILLGAAVSSFVDIAKAPSITAQQALTGGLLGVVGAIMIALQFARE